MTPNFLPGDRVRLDTDTAFDEEGVPIGVGHGARGIVTELDGFPQVLIADTAVGGPAVVGVPLMHMVHAQTEVP